MPEDLRVGPKMGMSSQCNAEKDIRFPLAEPGETELYEMDCSSDACMM
jgi:hypothetical protein